MAIAQIEGWLNRRERDYDTGRTLYNRYGASTYLKELFAQGDDSYNRQKLVSALRAISENTTDELTVDLPEAVNVPAPVKGEKPPVYKTISKEYIEKEMLWKDHYKQMNHLRSELIHTRDVSKRCAMAHEILDRFADVIHPIWAELDYFDNNGEWPVTVEKTKHLKPDVPVMDLITRRNTLRTYISKNKGDEHKQQQVREWKSELSEVENAIRNAF